MLAILDDRSYYSIDHTVEVEDDDGAKVEPVLHRSYFQIEDVTHSRKRQKLMHTVQSADDISLTQPLALLVRSFTDQSGNVLTSSAASAVRCVDDASEPLWMVPSRLGVFDDWVNRLHKWNQSVIESEPLVTLLWEPRRAVPTIPIMDKRCPTIMCIWALKKKVDASWEVGQTHY